LAILATTNNFCRFFGAEKLTHYQCYNPDCGNVQVSPLSGTPSSVTTPGGDAFVPKESESIKQTTAKVLPPVLSIQLKVSII
jgi:hypothetical protein